MANISPKSVELFVYVASKLGNKPNYGSSLLGNLLFLVDYTSYMETGRPISDFTYVKQEGGIGIKAAQAILIQDILKKENAIKKSNGFFTVHRNANLGVFNNGEVAIADHIIGIGKEKSDEIPACNKSFLAWSFAQNDEEIPFYTFQYNPKNPNPKDDLNVAQKANKGVS